MVYIVYFGIEKNQSVADRIFFSLSSLPSRVMTLHWTRKGTILQDFYWIAQCKTFIFIIIITYRPACAKNQSSAPLCYYRKNFLSATKPNPPQCMHANSHNDPVSLLICHTKKFLGLVIFGRFVARPQNRRETRAWERTFLNCTAVCVCVCSACVPPTGIDLKIWEHILAGVMEQTGYREKTEQILVT